MSDSTRRLAHALDWPQGSRAPLTADAVRAAYGAHLEAAHGGARGYGCGSCRRYVHGIVRAERQQREATGDAVVEQPPTQ